jgi:hypothetical protein
MAKTLTFRGEHLPKGPLTHRRLVRSAAVLLFRALIDGHNWQSGLGGITKVLALGEGVFVARHANILKAHGLKTDDDVKRVWIYLNEFYEDAKADFDRSRQEVRQRARVTRH